MFGQMNIYDMESMFYSFSETNFYDFKRNLIIRHREDSIVIPQKWLAGNSPLLSFLGAPTHLNDYMRLYLSVG